MDGFVDGLIRDRADKRNKQNGKHERKTNIPLYETIYK